MKYNNIIPELGKEGTWIGRCHIPGKIAYNQVKGPHVIWVNQGKVYDLSFYFKSADKIPRWEFGINSF